MENLDTASSLVDHKGIITKKKLLQKIYRDSYKLLDEVTLPKGKIVEIGSGGGIIKSFYPEVVTSDVVKGPEVDRVFSAEKIPYPSNSISAFFMLNVFHHIKNPEKALNEMERCLKKGGKIIMIEPYNSTFGRFIYTSFHHETFDPEGDWKIQGKGRMSDANGALPWIVFVRDRKLFSNKFPNLKINKVHPHTPFLYLLSGGLSKPQLIPTFAYEIFKGLEVLMTPIHKHIGMFATIIVEKR